LGPSRCDTKFVRSQYEAAKWPNIHEEAGRRERSHKRRDTVGELGSLENCASRLASLKAQDHRNAWVQRLACEGRNRFANSIRRFLRLSWGGAEMPCIEALGKGNRARTRLTREPFLSQRHRAKRGEVRAAATAQMLRVTVLPRRRPSRAPPASPPAHPAARRGVAPRACCWG
jgi:hypothetical protein